LQPRAAAGKISLDNRHAGRVSPFAFAKEFSMPRPVTLFTGQWADLYFGYQGIELACWGDHFEVNKADDAYCRQKRDVLEKYDLQCFAISNHLVGQAVCDVIDERHKSILPPYVWGDGKPAGVNQRAAEEMKATARAAQRLGVGVVNGFTGSSIWHLLYSFPPVPSKMIDAGFDQFAERWNPILDVFGECGVRFALEVHPTEIAFDLYSAERALDALDGREEFGFNFDPSHLHWQGVDPVDYRRGWDFRSPGRGGVNFEEIIRALNDVKYSGPLSVEWEDSGMDREHGAREACERVKQWDFEPSAVAFDAAFAE
jgi:sugar phosphate isomerase/epimerase